MNTIGINHNLDRTRVKNLLSIGLFASILTGIGDFLLGYAEQLPAATISENDTEDSPSSIIPFSAALKESRRGSFPQTPHTTPFTVSPVRNAKSITNAR